jgi:hypothetical protein
MASDYLDFTLLMKHRNVFVQSSMIQLERSFQYKVEQRVKMKQMKHFYELKKEGLMHKAKED